MTSSQKNRTLTIVASLLLLGVAGALFVTRMLPGSSAGGTQMTLVSVMSDQLAGEIKTLSGGEAKIICVSRENAPSMFASSKAVSTFRAAAEKRGHKVVAEAYVPLSEMHSTDQGLQLKVSSVLDLINQHSDATAVVSFVGIPFLDAGDAERLSGQSAKLVAVSFDDDSLDQLLADQVVDLAVVFHESTPTSDPEITPAELQQFISFRHAGE